MRHISRVLQVVAVMNQGGAENMIMNYYRAADKSKIQFDFLVHYPKRGFFDDEIEKMGGHIYRAITARERKNREKSVSGSCRYDYGPSWTAQLAGLE